MLLSDDSRLITSNEKKVLEEGGNVNLNITCLEGHGWSRDYNISCIVHALLFYFQR